MTFTSSDVTVVTLVTLGQTGEIVPAEIQPGARDTPTSAANGGVALDPLTVGSTTVSVTATGFVNAGAAVDVSINP